MLTRPRLWLCLSLAAFVLAACGEDASTPVPDATEDIHAPDTDDPAPLPDTEDTDPGDTDTSDTPDTTPILPDPGTPVELDLDAWLDPPGSGFVRAGIVTQDEVLVGDAAEARPGDAFLENEHGRYLIGFGDRAIGPCAWDGNPIDAAAMDADGAQASDTIMGQICLLLNVGQTFRPERLDILSDGSDGRAIVAVTGRTAWLDFLNLRTMVDGVVPGFLNLVPINPDILVPVTVTVVYGLSPESRSLRVVSGFRSDAETRIHFIATHLVLSGSTGSYFTPLGSTGGFGYRSLGADNIASDPVSFISYITGTSHYTYVPDPHPALEGRLPVGGGLIAVSGAVTVTHGADDLVSVLLAARNRLDRTRGYIGLDPGEISAVGYRLHVGTGSLQTTVDQVYADLEVDTGPISGRVVDHLGAPVADAMVTAIESEDGTLMRTLNQARTASDGTFSLRAPLGTYTLRVRTEGRALDLPDLDVDASGLTLGDVALSQTGEVLVRIRTPEGDPSPGRITVSCVESCGIRRAGSFEVEGAFQPPMGWERVVFVGVDGEHTLSLAPGAYRLHVSRGITWSVWPEDTFSTGGELIEVSAGDQREITAEIAQVVDTTGTLGADFHIHAMASPDSSVSDELRVLDFLAGGLDVMVSSDHDAVTDFAPTIIALGAQQHITSIIGNEITTPNIGHINAFPLERDESARRGGPIDWSNEGGYHMTLDDLAEALFDVPYERVLQINHPAGTGTFGVMKADVLAGQSFARRQDLRMSPQDPDPDTGDTGMWTDRFTAVEIQNGHGMANFWSGLRWWMTLIGRGFSPAGTSVSDTHGLFGSLGASPRSFVFVDEDSDSPATMDLPAFIRSINSGRLVGTNGPFVSVEITNADGDVASLGETLDIRPGGATAFVRIQLPHWMQVDTLDLYQNVEDDLIGAPGEAITTELAPTQRINLTWDPEEHRVAVRTGTYTHYRWEQTVEVPLSSEVDAWVVFMVRSRQGPTMQPVLSSGVRPLAFTNPIFLDADGNGYDNPPLAALAEARRMVEEPIRFQHVSPRVLGDHLTVEDIAAVLEAMSCSHDHDHGHHHGPGHHHHGPGHHHHGPGHHHHGPGHHHHGPGHHHH